MHAIGVNLPRPALRVFIAATVATVSLFTIASAGDLSDTEIRQILMDASRAAYSGSCRCPEDRDRAGRRCGARSAYSKPGGASPLCYLEDITKEMIAEFRTRGPR